MKRDELFAKKETQIGGFNFGEKTAEVFDDMLDRSVPLYTELQRMIGEIAAEFAKDGTAIYDLGCSTGITMATLMGAVRQDVQFVGVDYSDAMLARARCAPGAFTGWSAKRLARKSRSPWPCSSRSS